MASQVFSGARAIFQINGVPVGFAAGVSGSESLEFEPVDVLNLLEVKEFVPVAYRATLSAQIFRVVGESLKKAGIFPKSEQMAMLTGLEYDCVVTDRITNVPVATFQQCRASEHTFDVTARGIVSQNVTFVTIRVKDEWDLSA